MTYSFHFSSYGLTVLTKNNFRFIISHTLNLVHTGFCNWDKICKTWNFCAYRPLNIEWTLTAGNLSHSDFGYIYFTPCMDCINCIQYCMTLYTNLHVSPSFIYMSIPYVL